MLPPLAAAVITHPVSSLTVFGLNGVLRVRSAPVDVVSLTNGVPMNKVCDGRRRLAERFVPVSVLSTPTADGAPPRRSLKGHGGFLFVRVQIWR